jgi:S1-C subfamily serine protease
LNAASLAAGRKFSHRRRERESEAVPAAALICLLLLPGIAFDSSRPAAAEIFLSRGTGFFVSKDGRLLTNFHVIDSCRQLTVQSGRLSGAARVVATDPANDLALLATNLKPSRIADWRYSLREDEPVVVYGFSLAGERTVDGKVLGLTGWRNNKLVFTETGLEPGMSGSAVLDGSGLVIGISVEGIGRCWAGQRAPRLSPLCSMPTALRIPRHARPRRSRNRPSSNGPKRFPSK